VDIFLDLVLSRFFSELWGSKQQISGFQTIWQRNLDRNNKGNVHQKRNWNNTWTKPIHQHHGWVNQPMWQFQKQYRKVGTWSCVSWFIIYNSCLTGVYGRAWQLDMNGCNGSRITKHTPISCWDDLKALLYECRYFQTKPLNPTFNL